MSISDKKLEIELSSTQRVIQGITGYSVIMFRPPFLSINEGSNELPTKETFDKILKIQDLGYTVVGSSIDPQDWNGKSAEEIFKETTKNIRNSQIILLHDSGGDRTPTIEALPKIIEWLKANGYSIVPVSELVGMERSAVMPLVQETEESITPLYLYGSSFNAAFIKTVKIFLSLLIVIGLFRLAIPLFFSLKQKRKSKHRSFQDSYQPFVSILIAAYNEEKVIGKTIHSIMNSHYPQFELIIVTLDADKVIVEDTIFMIIRHFIDPNVGAVSGNVKIGNRKNLLTWWQHIEYVTGFNLEKRAFDELDSITVVPGAIGAWKKSAIKVGLFEEDTLAEDTDVTMKLLRKGYKN